MGQEPTIARRPAGSGNSMYLEKLHCFYGAKHAVKDVTLRIEPRAVTAIIGPSGCGKSTVLRSMNRMHEVIPGAYTKGKVLLNNEDIYAPSADAVRVRRRIGMVFQRPNPFPTKSIQDNILAGLKLTGRHGVNEGQVVERCLRQAALWDEVKDRLKAPATALSGGQQQRLCIARALAVEPEILLMDEPCSALDPNSTFRIEQLMDDLKKQYTIIIVTHNMQQAARVSQKTGFFLRGELKEFGDTDQIFTNPQDKDTEAYVSGQFG